jgi:hypothetical protein
MRLTQSKGPTTVGVSHPSHEEGNRSNFRNVRFSTYLEFWITDKVQKPVDSECYTPTSEPFRLYEMYNVKK